MKNIPIKVISIMLMILCISTCSNATSTAKAEESNSNIEVTLDNARNQIASWGESFCSSNAGRCVYDANRRGETYMASDPQSTYYFDCVGWVSFAINRSIGLDFVPAHRGYNEGGGGFVTPSGVKDTVHFAETSVQNAKRGDILIAPNGPHVAVYLGNGQVVDMWNKGLAVRGINSSFTMTGWSGCTFTKAASLISIDGVNFGSLPGGVDVSDIPAGTITATEVNLDDLQFNYSGMPTDVTNAGIHSFQMLINQIGEAMNYVIGVMFNGIKVVTVSIIEALQGILTNVFDALNGKNTTTV